MVDALASGASTGNGVEVRVLSWAPIFPENLCNELQLEKSNTFSVPVTKFTFDNDTKPAKPHQAFVRLLSARADFSSPTVPT